MSGYSPVCARPAIGFVNINIVLEKWECKRKEGREGGRKEGRDGGREGGEEGGREEEKKEDKCLHLLNLLITVLKRFLFSSSPCYVVHLAFLQCLR